MSATFQYRYRRAQFSIAITCSLLCFLSSCNNASFSGGDSVAGKKSASPATSDATGLDSSQDHRPQSSGTANAGQVTFDDGSAVKPRGRLVTEGGGSNEVLETFTAESVGNTLADIIFVMDSSSSMDEEKASLENQMAAFLHRLSSADSHLDYRVFVIGTGFTFSDIGDRQRFQLVPWAVGSFDGLTVLQRFLTEQPNLDLGLRDGATKEIVMISDQDAGSDVSRAFGVFGETYREAWRFNGFVGLPNSRQTSSCQISGAGRAYINLGKSHQGLIQDICQEDWGGLLANLANSIVRARRIVKYILAYPADKGQLVHVKVAGQDIAPASFKYVSDPEPAILFSVDKAPFSNQSVEVSYLSSKRAP